jgi:hypothetical protein
MADGDLRAATAGTVGQQLRRLREAAGQSVEQVSAATCVRGAVVRDLEADRFDSSGGAVYARGHVRALAHALGVDAAPLVAALDEQLGAPAPAPLAVVPLPAPRAPLGGLHLPVAAPPERRSPRWRVACLAVLGVLVGLLLVGTLGDDRGAPGGEARAVPSSAPVRAAVGPKPKPKPKPPAGAVLGLRAVGRSWVSVSTPARTLFEGTVQAGWAQRFVDPAAVRVRLGNAAGLVASCGGGASAPAGAEGAVLTLACGPQGMLRP